MKQPQSLSHTKSHMYSSRRFFTLSINHLVYLFFSSTVLKGREGLSIPCCRFCENPSVCVSTKIIFKQSLESEKSIKTNKSWKDEESDGKKPCLPLLRSFVCCHWQMGLCICTYGSFPNRGFGSNKGQSRQRGGFEPWAVAVIILKPSLTLDSLELSSLKHLL